MSQRRAATCINLTEFASLMDIPGESYVVRDVGYTRNPVGDAGASHHYSGAGLAIPKYSRNPAAAWVFIQWATVSSMQLIAAMDPLALAVPTRNSVYEDPNVQELIKEGTIRHFDTVKNAIDRDEINIKPGFPKWDSIEGEMLNQLNQVIRGNLSPRDALNIVQKRADDVGPFTF
jgi:multiple sugar transport system substrate-binding protein